ncbi:MAG: SdrD B-like domain-containing protein [Caldilineaceae bacterium]
MSYLQIFKRLKPLAAVGMVATLLLITFGVSLASPALFGKSTLGDFVWYDVNGDGIKNPNEPGINGVLINLYLDVNGNNQIDLGDQFITSTVTANDVGAIGDDTGGNNGPGFYDFSVDGGPGIVYIVEIPASNFAPGGPLDGYVYSGENATQAYNGPQPRVIPYPTNPDDKNDVDFPFYKMSLGNLVWEDFDNDGAKDANEPGLNNVPVALVDATTGQVVDTTLTSNGGWYTFTHVIAGSYVVSVTPPAGYLSSTGPSQEADPDANGDNNDNGLDTPVGGAIVSAPFDMQPHDPGALNNTVLDPTQASTHHPTIDFGLIKNFDLALIKRIHATQPTPIQPGQDVTFTITIINQGDFAAANVTVADYIPPGFTLSPLETDWNGGPTGTVSHALGSTLAAHSQTAVDIILRVNNPLTPGNYTNMAEIASATDQNGNPVVDVDSTPDSNNNNDGPPKDDVVNEDHKNNPTDDEDDHDISTLVVDVFDLALIKRLAVGQHVGGPARRRGDVYAGNSQSGHGGRHQY